LREHTHAIGCDTAVVVRELGQREIVHVVLVEHDVLPRKLDLFLREPLREQGIAENVEGEPLNLPEPRADQSGERTILISRSRHSTYLSQTRPQVRRHHEPEPLDLHLVELVDERLLFGQRGFFFVHRVHILLLRTRESANEPNRTSGYSYSNVASIHTWFLICSSMIVIISSSYGITSGEFWPRRASVSPPYKHQRTAIEAHHLVDPERLQAVDILIQVVAVKVRRGRRRLRVVQVHFASCSFEPNTSRQKAVSDKNLVINKIETVIVSNLPIWLHISSELFLGGAAISFLDRAIVPFENLSLLECGQSSRE
jgi:hypothetical protein